MMNGRFRWPVYVFFFTLLPVLSLLSANIYQMAVVEGLRAAVFISAVTGVLLLLIGLRTGKWHRAALVISLFLLSFLSYGHIYKLFQVFIAADNSDTTYTIASIIFLALLTGLVVVIWLRVKKPERLAQNLNIISLVMLALPLFNLTASLVESRSTAVPSSIALNVPQAAYSSSYRPDIYYIVLDGYARADVLSAVFQLDNSAFISELESHGFFVASGSRTNYINTVASLASSLNLQYLDDLAEEVGKDSSLTSLSNIVQNNQVQQILDSLDYETVTISSGYVNTEARYADRYLTSAFRGINHFETLLLLHTPVGRYFVLPGRLLPNGLQYDPHRDRIQFSFDTLARTASNIASPKFVYAHIVTPHPPFVFGPDGEAVQPDHPYTISDGSHYPGTRAEYIEGYRNQVTYINKLILETVEQILIQSQSTPIIIIQSDHGSGAYLKWNGPENNDCLIERAANFIAILTPDSRAEFYDTITPVNIFRLLFNSYLDTDFELLPDKTFFVRPNTPYDFKDISAQIDSSNACFIR